MRREPYEHQEEAEDLEQPSIGPHYARFQLARALAADAWPTDSEQRAQAQRRIAGWAKVLDGLSKGTLEVGSRTPVAGVPKWLTLEVLTGGFATGGLVAGGPLEPHEQTALARHCPTAPAAEARWALNAHYLGDAGLSELQALLRSGCYDVKVPEEGALLVVAWLVEKGHAGRARDLLAMLAPWFPRLRFYPVAIERACPATSRVFLQDVRSTLRDLEAVGPNLRILAQKEAVTIWTPLYDRAVQLFLETVEGEPPNLRRDRDGGWTRTESGAFPVEGGWPCRHYPRGWAERVAGLLDAFEAQRAEHRLCGRPQRAKDSFAQLLSALRRYVQDPGSLEGREVGRIRLILARYVAKRGVPGSAQCREVRELQARHAAAPTHQEVARVVIARLEPHPPDEGIDDLGPIARAITEPEATRWLLPAGAPVPQAIVRKLERSSTETVETLVERGLITSGEVLAKVLPQMTSWIRASGVADPSLRRLYASVDAAFRRRRSLLLLNLEKQVQLVELPWVAAMEPFRADGLSAKELARQTLTEVATLAIVSFPHAILPNKLLQELGSLAKTAGTGLPLVEEVAADIFMGEFSGKFIAAAKVAAELLDGTLYASYYGIDYQQVRAMQAPEPAKGFRFRTAERSPFVTLCAARAGVSIGRWHPATNGMIIEQQQILTTQNLAVLFSELGLAEVLRDRLHELAQRCFEWTCRRQQMKTVKWHARLIQVKHTAYAWRQMIFFLSWLPVPEIADFLSWAQAHLDRQPAAFGRRFQPALNGLVAAAGTRSRWRRLLERTESRRFLAWSNTKHWLLED